MLHPETITIDKTNKGNLSLQLLPKIDEMYVKLKRAKYFTILDLCSSYYHITVTPSGKYEFNKVPFGLAQDTSLLPRADPKSNRKCTTHHAIFRQHHNLQQLRRGASNI